MLQIITKFFVFNDVSNTEYKPFYYSKKETLYFILALIQFTSLLYLITYFGFEKNSGIGDYAKLILVAYIFNSILPLKFRPLALFLTTVSILIIAFGFFLTTIFLGFGFLLILCCHLNINFQWRLFLIVCITTVLIALKAEILYFEKLTVLTSFLASMFMFRLIVYLYEIKNGMIPKSMIQSISYFFMFPNLFFLFFPIVDYKTYIKTYYNKPEHEIWQKGIRWILRGLIHIFAYRILCSYFLISPSDIKDIISLLIYLIVNYALILRISGVFHLIIGLLCMFGMNLPQIFNNYFLATSFVDLWRRINIYWRDFILKVFYYPIMFRLKNHLASSLLSVTMMITFFITWFLHSYQLFWITGVVSIKWIDLIFWLTVGMCITINAIFIQNKLLKNKPSKIKTNTIPYYIITMLKIEGMLLTMSILWMFWNSQSITDWVYFISLSSVFSTIQIIWLVIIFLSITTLGVFIQLLLTNSKIKSILTKPPEKTYWLTSLSIISLCLFSLYNPTNIQTKTFKSALTNFSSNKNEKEDAEKSYYDGLMEGYDEHQGFGLGDKRIMKLMKKKSKRFYESSSDLFIKKIKKNLHYTDLGYLFSSNQFGMRDKYYSIHKPKNTFRVALLGGSYEMGSGVTDDAVFEKIVEDSINKNRLFNNEHFEILNFSVGGYYLIQHIKLCKEKVFQFNPDALIYFAHSNEQFHIGKDFATIVKYGRDLEFTELNALKSKLKLNSFMSLFEIRQKLAPYTDSLIYWSYKKIADDCKKNKCVPIWAFLLTTNDQFDQWEYTKIKGYAEKLGYITLDLSNPYTTENRREIQLSNIDAHPNVKGHEQLANCFYNQLLLKKDSILLRSKLMKKD